MTAEGRFLDGDFWLADAGLLAEAGNLPVDLERHVEPVDIVLAASEQPGVTDQFADNLLVPVGTFASQDRLQISDDHLTNDAPSEFKSHRIIAAEYQSQLMTIRQDLDDLQLALRPIGNVRQPAGKEPERVFVVFGDPVDLHQESANATWSPDCHDLSKKLKFAILLTFLGVKNHKAGILIHDWDFDKIYFTEINNL